MSDKYPTVVRLSYGERTWYEFTHRVTHKVVPVDALVIEKVDGTWPEWVLGTFVEVCAGRPNDRSVYAEALNTVARGAADE